MGKMLSFVIPCYRSEKTIGMVIDEIKDAVSKRPGYSYEIICVNDYSPDNVYDVLKAYAEKDKNIKVVNFSKNMGKHAAVLAGYAYADGDYIVNMDDDYQCPANEVWKLVDTLAEGGYDVVFARYAEKKESALKKFGSDVNLWMTNIMLDKPKDFRGENYFVMKAYVAKEMINYKSAYPYLEGLMFRVTNNVARVDMEQRERADDLASGFTFRKSVALWINGLTAFSVKPLRLATIVGFVFSAVGFIYALIIVLKKLFGYTTVLGYSSILAVVLISSGIMMMMLGLIGEYIGRIYICINAAPQYVIKDTININKADDSSKS